MNTTFSCLFACFRCKPEARHAEWQLKLLVWSQLSLPHSEYSERVIQGQSASLESTLKTCRLKNHKDTRCMLAMALNGDTFVFISANQNFQHDHRSIDNQYKRHKIFGGYNGLEDANYIQADKILCTRCICFFVPGGGELGGKTPSTHYLNKLSKSFNFCSSKWL